MNKKIISSSERENKNCSLSTKTKKDCRGGINNPIEKIFLHI